MLRICLWWLCLAGLALGQARRMVVFDQDTAGPGGTDLMSLLVLLQSPRVEVLGVTVVAGDGWRDDEVLHVLRLLELMHRGDIPVAAGAAAPLVRKRGDQPKVSYQGMWSNWPQGPLPVGAPLKEGRPATPPVAEDAAHFLVRIVRAHPHQVTVFACGPMTNLALALQLDPSIAPLSAGLVFMGGSVSPHTRDAGIAAAPHREFNFWFDPEAAHAVLRARWPTLAATTQDAVVETHWTTALLARLAAADSPAARYDQKYSAPGGGNVPYMWDELAAAAWLDPGLITRSRRLYMDVNVNRNSPAYGDTLIAELNQPHDSALQPVTAQLDADIKRFEDSFVALMRSPPPAP